MHYSRKTTLPGWLSLIISVAFAFSAIAVVIFAYLTWQIVYNKPVNPVVAAAEEVADVRLDMEQEGPAAAPTIQPGEPTPTLYPTTEAWQGSDRVNILLMGIDRRPGEAFISRTDSMMVISIDPVNNSAAILSVPRDLYVVIPGYGRDRINTAYVYGSGGNNPVGGAALAMQTVEYNLGVRIHHYVMVDFGAVVRGINAIGGIDVNIPVAINDPTYPDMNYGYSPLFIPAGSHHFDGAMALKYARTRHQDNDFGRAARQQQVLMAVRRQILNWGVVDFIKKAPELYTQVEQGVRTDLSLQELTRLAKTMTQIESDDVETAVLDYNYVTNHRTERGAAVLLLNLNEVTPLIRRLFYDE